jgi:hypothetical protein
MKIINVIDQADVVPYFYEKTKIKMNVLTAYNYLPGQAYKLAKQYREMIESFYLDSSAYSVSRGKAGPSVSEYRRYIRRFGSYFDEVFSLDDDFNNPDHNFNNQVFLEKDLPEGAKRPIPVIHDPDAPLDEFSSYADQGYEYIAIGSNKKHSVEILNTMKETYPDVKIHLFGNLTRKVLMEHKPYSCDSASWAHQAGFGSINFWHAEDEKEYQIYLGEMDKKDKKFIHFNQFDHKQQLEAFLAETFQFEYRDLLTSSYNKWIVNLYFLKQLEDHINASGG